MFLTFLFQFRARLSSSRNPYKSGKKRDSSEDLLRNRVVSFLIERPSGRGVPAKKLADV
jgi:hypothetical protein